MDTVHLSDKAFVEPNGTLHEIYSGNIFIGNSHLGSLSYDSGRSDLRWQRNSLAYFCDSCGDIWARTVMQDSDGRFKAYDVVKCSCEKHQDSWNVPGSLLVGHYENLLKDLPPDAVRREFEIHLLHTLKELEL